MYKVAAKMASNASAVWKYFLKESNENALCLLCHQYYSRKGRGTTNLRNHLKSKHKEQYVELLEEEKIITEKRDLALTPIQRVEANLRQRKFEVNKSNQEKDLVEIPFVKVECDIRENTVEASISAETEDLIETPIQEQTDIGQKVVDEYFTSLTLWNALQFTLTEIDKYVSEMLVMDNLPSSHVEGVGFIRLMLKLVPQHKLKKQNFYSSMICTDIYDAVCGQIKKMLRDITNITGNGISLTTDTQLDTSTGITFLSVTAHVINSEFERQKFVLGVQPLEREHTGEYITKKFNDILEKWEISHNSVHCVLTNTKNAPFLSRLNNMDCAVHKIQMLVMQAFQSHEAVSELIKMCRNLATHFKHSTIAQDELKKIQEQLQLPHLKVLHESPGQCNSTLRMLRRIEEIKETLCIYMAENLQIPQFTSTQWIILTQCIKAIEPYEDLTKRLCESTSTLADIIPLTFCLKKILQATTFQSAPQDLDLNTRSEDFQRGVAIVSYMKETMEEDIDQIFSRMETDNNYTVATYLDPRYKGRFFSAPYITKQAQETVACFCDKLAMEDDEPRIKRKRNNELMATSSKSTDTSIENVMALILASSSDEEPEQIESNSMIMVHKYHKQQRLGLDGDPLKWWKANITEYPELGKLAQKYLSCPASRITSDQLYCGDDNKFNDVSRHLDLKETNKRLFLKENLPLLNFEY